MFVPFQLNVHQFQTDAEGFARHFKVRASLGVFFGVVDLYLQIFKLRILTYPAFLSELSRRLV